jgi:hypothetical protein
MGAENWTPIVGECMRMCPEDEALARQESRDLSYFEIIPGTGSKEHGDVPLVDLSKAVKKYKRAAAAQTLQAKDVRPPAVLAKTMEYLLAIMDRTDSPDPPPLPSFLVIFRFVSDRLRALRTDFNCQNLKTALAVQCFERAARFHILTMYELGDLHNIEKWDPTPNMEKLSQTLTSLRHMYLDNYTAATAAAGTGSGATAAFPTPDEAEFHAYRLLIELGSGRFGRLYEEMDKFAPEVKGAPVVQLAVAAYNAIKEDNYVRFFALARSAPYLVAVLLNLQFNRVRARALEIICAAYLSFPLATFVQQLAFENEEHARDFLDYYSVSVDENAGSGGATIQTKQVTRAGGRGDSAFQRPPHGTTPYPHRNSSALVGSKRPAKVSTAVLTGLGRGEHIGIESFVLPQAQAAAAAAAATANVARVRMVVRAPKPSTAPSMDADMISRAMDAAAAAGTTNGGAFGGSSAFGGGVTTAKPGRSSTAAAAAPIPSLLPAASFPSRPSFGGLGGNGLTSAAPSFELPSAEALSGLSSKPTKITRNIVPSSSGGALTNANNGGFGLSAFPSTVAAPPLLNLSGAAAAAPSSSSMLNPRAKEWMPPSSSSTAAGTGSASAFPSTALSATASAFAPAAAATSGGFGAGSAFAGFGPAAVAASTTATTATTTAGGAGFGGGFGSSAFGASATAGATTTGAVGFGSSFPTFGSGAAATGSAFGGAGGSSAAPAWGATPASSSSASASSAFAPASSSSPSSFSTSAAAALSTKPSPAPVSAFGATPALATTTASVPPATSTPPAATVAAGGAFGFGAPSTGAASTLQRSGASVSTKPPPPSAVAAAAPVPSFAAAPTPSQPQPKPQLPETTTTNIAGFQLPVAGSMAAATTTSSSPPVSLVSPPPPMLQAPPLKSKSSAAAAAEAPVAHPRPPMRSSAVAGAGAALPAAASKAGAAEPSVAGGSALPVRRAPSEAVFMDTTEPTRAASIAALQQQPPSRPRRRPTTPTPARLQEMFLQSLRAYRRSLLSMALAGWHSSFAAAQKAREEKEAFERKLNARADAFAATKWFLRWHDSMRRQREAQERFNTAQALLHAPPIFLLSAKPIPSAVGAQSLASSPKLLLPASSDVSTLALPAGGVASGLSTPLVKLHRMGLDVPVDATTVHDGGDDYDGPQGVLDFADAADYDEEDGEYAAAAAEGEEEEEQEEAGEGEGEGEYIEGDEDGDDVYADEEGEGEEEQAEGQDGAAETEEQAADGVDADLAPMDHAEDDDSPPTPSRSLLGTRSTRSPAIHGRTATAPFSGQFASPPAFGAFASAATPSRSPHIAVGPGLSSSHKRSRQSLEIDRFLSEYVSPRRALRQQQQQQSSPAAAATALYSLDGAPLLLEDDSEAEDDARVRAGAAADSRSSRAKLFHTPSRDAARAMFASPTVSSSALDVNAALHAASASPSSELAYLRPQRYGSSSPFASPARFGALLANGSSSSSAAAAASASLSQKVASEVRASGKLDELMQQLEYRFGAAV